MERPSESPSESSRERSLTVTYGVGSGSARTVSIPIARANAMLVVFVAGVVWTGISILYLSARSVTTLVAEEQPAAMPPRAALMPRRVMSGAASVAAAIASQQHAPAPAVAPIVLVPTVDKPVEKIVERPTEKLVETTANKVVEAAPIVGSGLVREPATRLPASLDNLTFASTEGEFKVRFNIVNQAPKAIAGKVSGRAIFQVESGETVDVASDESPGYRAKMRSAKQLSFTPPEGRKGFFTSVEILVKDDKDVRSMSQVFAAPAELR